MSINFRIYAEREIFIPSVNKSDTQQESFHYWQTPTKASYQIIESDNPIQAYKDWVLSNARDEQEDVYDDPFDDVPSGTKTVNYGKEHVVQLDKWISEVESDGYVIKYEVW